MKGNYTLICGMEVHAELKTSSKMFCGCKNDPFHAPDPNMYTCPVCLGMPGGLPIPNKRAIEWVIKLGLALNCKINLFSKFDRKHYFYPDLPKGYQISQYDIPFCYDGYIETSEGRVGITRIHLEEDTGKLLHTTVDGRDVSLVDYNRSGVPLVEIVSEPDIHSASQAKEYGKKLRQMLRYLDIADADMEQGGMRLEANTSLQSFDEAQAQQLPAYKVEVKNINSFRFLEQAIEHEISRQSEILAAGEIPIQETRGYNSTKGITFSQRSKEDAEDYRYFPDPDIPPIRFNPEQIEKWRATLPVLPETKRSEWESLGIDQNYLDQFLTDHSTVKWIDSVFTLASAQNISARDIANAIVNKKISATVDHSPQSVVEKYLELTQTDKVDQNELELVIDQVFQENSNAVYKFTLGQQQVVGFLMGQVMRKLGKKVDPQQIRRLLLIKLETYTP